MAKILNELTLGEVLIAVVDSNPTISPGLTAPIGSLVWTANPNDIHIYIKVLDTDIGWELLA